MRWLVALAAAFALSGAVAIAGAAPAAPNVCHDTPIDTALVGRQPGDLLAAPQDVTASSGLLPGAGRLYRIAYATTGEAGSVVASCGLVAVPQGTGTVKGIVAWAHGTIGLMAKCQPSEDPAQFIGPMPAGIGAVTKKGTQAQGALVGMLRDGYAVVATDYPSGDMGKGAPLQYYALGVPEGLAVIDSARMLTHNATAFGLAQVADDAQLPMVVWGHSQGGGSALWAGQLASGYLSSKADRTLNLAGIAAEAPATQFTTSPTQPEAYMGKHLGDRDIYNFTPGLKVEVPIGAVLFSYVTASWSQVTQGTAGAYPVGPTAHVDYQDVLTKSGARTAPTVAKCCLTEKGLLPIYDATAKYLDPNAFRFFAEPFAGARVADKWQGAIDATCATRTQQPPAFDAWCQWLQFNMPGPNGVNPYPKLPLDSTGGLAPMLLAQGRDDKIIWCVDPSGAVQGTNCLTAQYAQSVRRAYCGGEGSLAVQYFPGVGHLQVPGAVASMPGGDSYAGSPLDDFVQGAIAHTLEPGCDTDPNTLRNRPGRFVTG